MKDSEELRMDALKVHYWGLLVVCGKKIGGHESVNGWMIR